ncbi:glycoside hydrolase family 10 protein [Dothidotthia symphoricarpi CBS 119687]|uniref:Beta-xylanase n=1 Tax=Dothidotthia symphoricarpi CBS 119687 TaxID=1392245 RepID=A0A6A6A4J5_9PLEO|nr:glycoside hydrolase family 10 protein [Dothidotthia symphoricarpi CBS 119687]KAF2125827.1 glycoside hydrolase family 10 protein [Dothidotthia symphoricarpi CBS 119687]
MKFTFAAFLLPLTFASPTPKLNRASGLASLAKHAGLRYFGTAVDSPALSNPQYTSIAFNKSEFNSVTLANGQKWMYTEPQRNVFNYTDADIIINLADKAGQAHRCHNFVWHQQLPTWLTSQSWSKAELISILENHIKNQATYFRDKCYAWDVVNEAYNDNGTYRSSIFYETIGPSYIELAFKFARKYTKPGTKLYYNDYNIETVNNKSLAVQAMVKDFQARHIPIDAVGLQSHFITGMSPSYQQIRDAQALFTSRGLETAITELDVRTTLPDSPEKQATQAKNYADSVKACVDEKRCVGVTVWDFWDPASWVPSTFPGQGNADLWDENFQKKPAYWAIADMLMGYKG